MAPLAGSGSKRTKGKIEMRKKKGFSLIELLIVVAIILIIAAIAIPNLLRARMAANEASAVGSTRTLNTAEISYNSTFPAAGFSTSLANLGGTASPCVASTASACLIDSVLSSGTKAGYSFAVGAGSTTGTPQPSYSVIATPVIPNQTGTRYFCSFEDAVVRAQTSAIASCTGAVPPLQ
jgi:prepilin-type N-terminal cleavage/methylation domain-containing protein